MRYFVCFLTLLACAAPPAAAATILYQGTFFQDNQVQEFVFTVAAPTTITLETYGYAGGTVGATTVPAGGFDPIIAVFSPWNPATPTYGSECGGSAIADSATTVCADAYLSWAADAGTYTVALMVRDNSPTGGPADPFAQDGNPGFTCAGYGGSGSFCDLGALGQSRTGDWALAITGADSTQELPEPGAICLSGIGLALVALLARRRGSLNRRIG